MLHRWRQFVTIVVGQVGGWVMDDWPVRSPVEFVLTRKLCSQLRDACSKGRRDKTENCGMEHEDSDWKPMCQDVDLDC